MAFHIHWSVLIVLLLALLHGSLADTMVMESYHVRTDIRNRFATTCITSKIRNTQQAIENVGFVVALPKEAFIVSCNIETGGKKYEGLIRERTVFKKNRGGQGRVWPQGNTIPTFMHSNTFEVAVDVNGGSNVTFAVSYVQMLKRKFGRYENQVYLIPGQVLSDLVVEVSIREKKNITLLKVPALRDPQYMVNADDNERDNSLARIDKSTPNSAHVIFAPTKAQQSRSGLCHTFVVQYDVDHGSEGDVIIWNGFFVHFLAPSQTVLPKDIVFVLDVSGSMSGIKIEQLKTAMMTILDDLREQDHFNVVPFNSGASVWRANVEPATSSLIANAKNYVKNLKASGETNIKEGIMTARQVLNGRKDTSRVGMIFFLTDGQDRTDIPIDASLPIYGLAFGDDADYEYIKALSTKNSGFARKIYTNLDAATQVANFYEEISSISLQNVSFIYDQDEVDITTLTKTVYPIIFMGSEAVVSGKLKQNVTQMDFEIDVAGASGQEKLVGSETETLVFDPIENENGIFRCGSSYAGLKLTWAYLTIQEKLIEEQKRATTQGQTKTLEEILYRSLENGFVTPLTSMVFRDPESGAQEMESAILDEDEKEGDSRIIDFIKARPPTTTDPTTSSTTTTTSTPTTTTTTTTTPMPTTISTTTTAPIVVPTSEILSVTEKAPLPPHIKNILIGTLTAATVLTILSIVTALIIKKILRRRSSNADLELENACNTKDVSEG